MPSAPAVIYAPPTPAPVTPSIIGVAAAAAGTPPAPPAPTTPAPVTPSIIGVAAAAAGTPVAPPGPTTPAPVTPRVIGVASSSPITPAAAGVAAVSPVAASYGFGDGVGMVRLTARVPGVDGNLIEVLLGNGGTSSPVITSQIIAGETTGDGFPNHPQIRIMTGGNSAVKAVATLTVPIGESVTSDAYLTIAGTACTLHGAWSVVDQGAANSRAALIQTFLNSTYDGLLTTSRTNNVIRLTLMNGGADGNATTFVKSGTTNGVIITAFSGGADDTTTTADALVAAINAEPNPYVIATSFGSGHIVVDSGFLEGGIGLAAPIDPAWPPRVAAPVTPAVI